MSDLLLVLFAELYMPFDDFSLEAKKQIEDLGFEKLEEELEADFRAQTKCSREILTPELVAITAEALRDVEIYVEGSNKKLHDLAKL